MKDVPLCSVDPYTTCCASELYGCGWYNKHYPLWTEALAAATENALNDIIVTYWGDQVSISAAAYVVFLSCDRAEQFLISTLLPILPYIAYAFSDNSRTNISTNTSSDAFPNTSADAFSDLITNASFVPRFKACKLVRRQV